MVHVVGTNYSLDLGERSFRGGTSKDNCTFTWAVPPELIALLPPECCVTNEYGEETSLGAFREKIADDYEERQVGRWFS